MKMPISTRPNTLSCRKTTAHGYRKITSTSNTTNSIARIGVKEPRLTGGLPPACRYVGHAAPCRVRYGAEPPTYVPVRIVRKPRSTCHSPRRSHPGQGAYDPVGGVASRRLVQVRQELEDDLHQRRTGQPVGRRELHHA